MSRYSICAPAFTSAPSCPFVADSNSLRKLGNADRFAPENNDTIGAFVSLLLRVCGPAAVFGRVAKLVIFTVNRMLRRWAMPHVFNEALKAAPSIADCDVSLRVLSGLKRFIAFGSGPHVYPTTVGSCGAASAAFAVNLFRLGKFHASALPATSAPAGSEMGTKHDELDPAIAPASPSCISPAPILSRPVEDYPFSKSLTRNVFNVWVRYGTGFFSFDHSSSMVEVSKDRSALTDGLCAFMLGVQL